MTSGDSLSFKWAGRRWYAIQQVLPQLFSVVAKKYFELSSFGQCVEFVFYLRVLAHTIEYWHVWMAHSEQKNGCAWVQGAWLKDILKTSGNLMIYSNISEMWITIVFNGIHIRSQGTSVIHKASCWVVASHQPSIDPQNLVERRKFVTTIIKCAQNLRKLKELGRTSSPHGVYPVFLESTSLTSEDFYQGERNIHGFAVLSPASMAFSSSSKGKRKSDTWTLSDSFWSQVLTYNAFKHDQHMNFYIACFTS